jgi:hypothetical protein
MVGALAMFMVGCAAAPEVGPEPVAVDSPATTSERKADHKTEQKSEQEPAPPAAAPPTQPKTEPQPQPKTEGGANDAGAPPTGKANWESCTADADCATNRCGCNGAAKMVCLPSAAYPKTCTPPKANWEPCGSDAECATDRCGCNGASAMVCLPNADYPKTCN